VGTNLSWTIDAHTLAQETGIPRVTLINDLHAVGEAVQRLAPDDFVALQKGKPIGHGVKAIIAAGTGLGQAFLSWTGVEYVVHDSEGGHASFSARNADEWALLQSLSARFGHVSRERVISGPGLINIYLHLAARGIEVEQAAVQAEMSHDDVAGVIGRHALAWSDPLSMRAMDMFLSAYGAQAGNLALTVMAEGGIYVAGGIAPQVIPILLDGTFMNAFLEKGRLSPFLARVPVHVIVNPHVGLIGAAAVALRNARQEKRKARPKSGVPCGA
jgi:glucokinase